MFTVERHPDAVDATVDSELVVMNIQSLDYYRFNPVAKRIWELVESGPRSEDSLVLTLLDEYDVEESECRTAVREFVEDSIKRGFLRTV